MGKYLEVTRIYMKSQLAWRADVVFNMIFTISKILFAYLLWSMVYEGKEMVGQLSFHAMLSYYIISSFLAQLEKSGGISSEIHERIRNGTFSKYMVIPVQTTPLSKCCGVAIAFGSRFSPQNLLKKLLWGPLEIRWKRPLEDRSSPHPLNNQTNRLVVFLLY